MSLTFLISTRSKPHHQPAHPLLQITGKNEKTGIVHITLPPLTRKVQYTLLQYCEKLKLPAYSTEYVQKICDKNITPNQDGSASLEVQKNN